MSNTVNYLLWCQTLLSSPELQSSLISCHGLPASVSLMHPGSLLDLSAALLVPLPGGGPWILCLQPLAGLRSWMQRGVLIPCECKDCVTESREPSPWIVPEAGSPRCFQQTGVHVQTRAGVRWPPLDGSSNHGDFSRQDPALAGKAGSPAGISEILNSLPLACCLGFSALLLNSEFPHLW